ncbi:MAG TPA: hypothetical protein VMI35_11895, partial [Puia sp.]|nr:hypothetical protein [Puia sp.]
DKKIREDFEAISKKTDAPRPGNGVGPLQIQYLYMRSFFGDYDMADETFPAINYFAKQLQQHWTEQNRYLQGMIALFLYRRGDSKPAKDILTSLKQNAITNPENGIHWAGLTDGIYWQQAPIETQSLLVEAFSEIAADQQMVDGMKTWLLRQKQTEAWPTTRATADACYALLLRGTDWLQSNPSMEITLGDKSINSRDEKPIAGLGYFKKIFPGPFVNPAMGQIRVTVSNNTDIPTWGAVYWQYFEDLNKITAGNSSLRLGKKIFREINGDRGPVLEPVAENQYLHPGDKIRVRIELRADRDLEYIHMKDTRASCMEPVNVLSGYKWQGGLGYYETTRDVSTDFFFPRLPKGTYVFEYPLFVTHTGHFSNGITNIECMYAPEFSAHSEGITVNVENK